MVACEYNEIDRRVLTYLMAELVITALKFGIWDPDGLTIAHLHHPSVDILPQPFPEHIRVGS
jgi:hypothetical protein